MPDQLVVIDKKEKNSQFSNIINDRSDTFQIDEAFRNELAMGYKSNCSVCNHPYSIEATILFYKHGKQSDLIKKWFSDKHDKRFNNDAVDDHFKNHIVPHVKEDTLKRFAKAEELRNNLMLQKTNNSNRLTIIKEIIWSYLFDVYIFKPDSIVNSSDLNLHSRMSREATELAKAYKDICAFEFEVLGYGKTEEEQKLVIQNYVKDTIKKHLSLIKDEHPEAYQKIAGTIGLVEDR